MKPPRPLYVLVTCEHGGNRVPARYRRWFEGHAEVLATHRGYDAGALSTARRIARATGGHLVATTVSRLVVELNRSPRHPRVFSEFMRRAPAAVRREAFEAYYTPYHGAVARMAATAIARGARVVHIGSHSFTPVLDGHVRRADAGILYDPARPLEGRFAASWLAALRGRRAGVVRRNYPYRGRNDGLPTLLRHRFAPADYLGLELEVNQCHALAGGAPWRRLQRAIVDALIEALGAFANDRTARPAKAGPALTPRRGERGSARRSPAAASGAGSRAASPAGR